MSEQRDNVDCSDSAIPPVWASITQHLGATRDDRSSNVRCNLATLAAAVSAKDPDALAALIDFGADAAERLAAESTPSERLVLQTVMAERLTLDPDVRPQFDQAMKTRLEAAGATSNAPRAVDALLLAVPAVNAILPPQLLVEAVLTDVRSLPSSDRQPVDATERDRTLRRLTRLREAVEGLADTEREAFRRAMTDQLAGFARRDRRSSLLAIMRWSPWVAKVSPRGTPIATLAQFESAAGYDRPRLLRVMWWALCGGVIGVASLTILTMLVLWDRYFAGTWTLPTVDIVFDLGVLAAFVALLSGVAFIPSVGRALDSMRSLLRLCLPSLAGAVAVTVGALFIDVLDDGRFFSMSGHPEIRYPVLFVTQFLLQAVVFWSLSLALRDILVRRTEWQVSLAVLSAAGPAIVFASLVCGVGDVLGIRSVVELWPILVVSLIAVALVATRIEIAKWPVIVVDESATARRFRRLAVAASALPIGLAAVGIGVTVVCSWWVGPIHPYRLSTARSAQHLVMQPHRHIEITLDGSKKVTIKAQPGDHIIYMFRNGDPMQLDADFQVSNRDELCVDDCGNNWPKLGEWLPLLVGGQAMDKSVDISVEVTQQ